MIFRFCLLLIGFGLAVVGGISLLAYLNLFAAGYNLLYYLKFILHTLEFYFFLIGLLITNKILFVE
ncbi:MAG: hypothetical protein LRY71_14185 [Bacillaceae bacterium]|nr:hypothetical protein [Bacillaceae bacterium]